MPRVCVVPGCKTGYISQKQEHGHKLSLFGAPKDDELLKKWHIAVRRGDRMLTHKDHVCELHFTEDSIIRYYEYVIEGEVIQHELGVYRLKKDAVPTIFSWSPPPKEVKKRKKEEPTNKEPIETPEIVEFISEPHISPYDLFSDIPMLNENEEPLFTWNELSQNLRDINKPNDCWTISEIRHRILCVCWDEELCEDKKVIVGPCLCAEVFIKGCSVKVENNDISSISSLSLFLQKVDKIVPCQTIVVSKPQKVVNCCIYMEDSEVCRRHEIIVQQQPPQQDVSQCEIS